MLSARLKETTKTAHQQLEKKVVFHLKNIRSDEDYKRLLSYFYLYFSALEKEIALHLPADALPDAYKRRRASLLAEDIQSLGGTTPVGSGVPVPDVKSSLQALGALYVMEGSTLGGPVIVNMLREKAGITRGVSFFSGYGSETMALWQSFLELLNQSATTEQQQEEVIAAANDTFQKFSSFIND